MAYKAALTKNFLTEFKKLPEDVRDRILRVIDEIIANPFLGVKSRGELATVYPVKGYGAIREY